MASRAPKSDLTKSEVVDPVATPTFPTGGLWTVQTSTTIEAPLEAVFEASVNISKWPEWNTFIPQTTIQSQPSPSSNVEPGAVIAFHSRMKADGPPSAVSNHYIVAVDPIERNGGKGWSIVWRSIMPGGDWILRAERVQELVEADLGHGKTGTTYKTWGTFGGPVAYLLSWNGTKMDIRDRFEDYANDLKQYVEK